MDGLTRASTVVVVEEDPCEGTNAGAMLASRGFRVRSTSDAAEAVELVRDHAADVVILGLARRWETLDLIRRLRGRFEPIPLAASPHIVVAARDMDAGDERFARSLGADVVLRAPLDERAVFAAVSHLARQPLVASGL